MATCDHAKPAPANLAHHLTPQTRSWPASAIKSFYRYFQIPGIGQTAGGLPYPGYFPFDSLEANVAVPSRFEPSSSSSAPRSSGRPTTARLVVPHDSPEPNPARKIDLASALQYGTAEGYPPLHDLVRSFAREHLHPNVPYAGGPDIVLTVGSTDGFAKCMAAMVEPWVEGRDPVERKQGILAEQYAYTMSLTAAWPRGVNVAPVKTDSQGMLASGPGGLGDVLEHWDYSRGARPHLLYTVTLGHNPTGGILGVQRRRELYALCQQYDVIIIEDEPYWFLQYPTAAAADASAGQSNDNVPNGRTQAPAGHADRPSTWRSSGYAFLDSLAPSYLSLDTDGRVVRLDTFSKMIAPGCRLGWITAQPYFIERLTRLTETSTQQPSGFVQSMVAQLLVGASPQAWQVDGWVRWLEGLRGNYERRMQTMCRALDDGAFVVNSGRLAGDDEWAVVQRTKVLDYQWPRGGMFVWLRVAYETHALAGRVAGPRLAQALFVYLTHAPFLVLVSPGTIFGATADVAADRAWQYFRLCFAALDEADVGPVAARFARGVRAFWRIRDAAVVERLAHEVESAEAAAAAATAAAAVTRLTGYC